MNWKATMGMGKRRELLSSFSLFNAAPFVDEAGGSNFVPYYFP